MLVRNFRSLRCESSTSAGILALGTAVALAMIAGIPAIGRAEELPTPMSPPAASLASDMLATPSGVSWIEPAGIPGSLVIVGGGSLPDSVRDKFLELAGGKEARIVVIPTASDAADTEDAEVRRRQLAPWDSLGAAEVSLLHTRSPDEANRDEFVAPLKSATAVWFGGGDQSKIAAAYLGTAVERELAALLARGGVIGGTSAGAAIQSRVMIAGGTTEPKMATGFDLLPGTIIDQHFIARRRQDRLRKALADHPGLVGIGLDEGTALVVQGRSLEVLGESVVSIFLAEGGGREPREMALPPKAQHDLTMLRRAAQDRAANPFPPEELPEPKLAAGSLVIVGGGGMPREVVSRFLELAGGPDAPIVVLPTASGEDPADDQRSGRFLERAGARKVTTLSQRTRSEVESPEFLAALSEAKGVWFGGGRQWRFVDCYGGTKAEAAIYDVLRRGGVIGGSSAGASIQAQYMVRGSVLGNLEPMAEGYERGFNYLPGTAIDQHFSQRGRQRDMTRVVHRHPQLLGIGLDEGTAIIVQGQKADVVGEGKVYFYDRRAMPKEGPMEPPAEGEPDYVALAAGETFDLVERKAIPAADERSEALPAAGR
jgi:cyanophycinase